MEFDWLVSVSRGSMTWRCLSRFDVRRRAGRDVGRLSYNNIINN